MTMLLSAWRSSGRRTSAVCVSCGVLKVWFSGGVAGFCSAIGTSGPSPSRLFKLTCASVSVFRAEERSCWALERVVSCGQQVVLGRRARRDARLGDANALRVRRHLLLVDSDLVLIAQDGEELVFDRQSRLVLECAQGP